MNNRKSLQARDIGQLDNNQEATDKKIISGYFIVFDTQAALSRRSRRSFTRCTCRR